MLNLRSSGVVLRLGIVFGLLATLAVLIPLATAQTTIATGSIVGTVTDASGAVLPGAKIMITGPTGQVITATTNDQGGYTAGNLIPGVYKVRFESKGFKTSQLTLDVKVANAANGSIKLEIGQEST